MTTIIDINPSETWTGLAERADSILVDVRTNAEWSFVGIPDLSSVNKQAILIEDKSGIPTNDHSALVLTSTKIESAFSARPVQVSEGFISIIVVILHAPPKLALNQ